mmetsp:Transcript_21306/g.43226  ORF Transcript_21306/g.43226 Transcript_21306/m.43226 type:complete len:462 (+) Transcript_21306:532-1917(+)
MAQGVTAEGWLGATTKTRRSGKRRSAEARRSEIRERHELSGTRDSSSLPIMSAGSRTVKAMAAKSAFHVRTLQRREKSQRMSLGTTSTRNRCAVLRARSTSFATMMSSYTLLMASNARNTVHVTSSSSTAMTASRRSCSTWCASTFFFHSRQLAARSSRMSTGSLYMVSSIKSIVGTNTRSPTVRTNMCKMIPRVSALSRTSNPGAPHGFLASAPICSWHCFRCSSSCSAHRPTASTASSRPLRACQTRATTSSSCAPSHAPNTRSACHGQSALTTPSAAYANALHSALALPSTAGPSPCASAFFSHVCVCLLCAFTALCPIASHTSCGQPLDMDAMLPAVSSAVAIPLRRPDVALAMDVALAFDCEFSRVSSCVSARWNALCEYSVSDNTSNSCLNAHLPSRSKRYLSMTSPRIGLIHVPTKRRRNARSSRMTCHSAHTIIGKLSCKLLHVRSTEILSRC